MQCEKCRRQLPTGSTYTFYYGQKGATETSFEGGAKVRRTSYKIVGQDGAWICSRCVNILYIPSVVFGVFILVLFLLVSIFPELNVPNAVCFGALGIALLIAALRSRNELGEWLAIRVRRKSLTSQGYNAFFTSLGYRMLNKPQ